MAEKAALPTTTQSNIRQLLSKKDKEAADAAAARFFYANGIAANVARSPYFEKFIDAVATYGKGYKPLKADALLTKFCLTKRRLRFKRICSLFWTHLRRRVALSPAMACPTHSIAPS